MVSSGRIAGRFVGILVFAMVITVFYGVLN
jgi:hypothetical protein